MTKRNYLPDRFDLSAAEPFYRAILHNIARAPWRNDIDVTHLAAMIMGAANLPVRATQHTAVHKSHRIVAWHILQVLEQQGRVAVARESGGERKPGEGGTVWRLVSKNLREVPA